MVRKECKLIGVFDSTFYIDFFIPVQKCSSHPAFAWINISVTHMLLRVLPPCARSY